MKFTKALLSVLVSAVIILSVVSCPDGNQRPPVEKILKNFGADSIVKIVDKTGEELSSDSHFVLAKNSYVTVSIDRLTQFAENLLTFTATRNGKPYDLPEDLHITDGGIYKFTVAAAADPSIFVTKDFVIAKETDYYIADYYEHLRDYKMIKVSDLNFYTKSAIESSENHYFPLCFDNDGNAYVENNGKIVNAADGKDIGSGISYAVQVFSNNNGNRVNMTSYDNMTNCLYAGNIFDSYDDPEIRLDCFNLSTGEHEKKTLLSEGENPLKDLVYYESSALTVYNDVYYFHIYAVESEETFKNFVLKYDAKSEPPAFETIEVSLDDRLIDGYNYVKDSIVQDDKVYLITAAVNSTYGEEIHKGNNYRGILSYPLDFDATKREVILGDNNVQHIEIQSGFNTKILQKTNPSDKEFVAPDYFVAVKPKKLVVKDSGFLWVDRGDAYFYRTVTEVDLESLTLSIHDSNWGKAASDIPGDTYRFGFSSFER